MVGQNLSKAPMTIKINILPDKICPVCFGKVLIKKWYENTAFDPLGEVYCSKANCFRFNGRFKTFSFDRSLYVYEGHFLIENSVFYIQSRIFNVILTSKSDSIGIDLSPYSFSGNLFIEEFSSVIVWKLDQLKKFLDKIYYGNMFQ